MSVEPLERSPTDKRVRRPGRGKGSDLAVRVAQPLILLLLPLLAWQGKHVRSRVPWLPEAEGPRSGAVLAPGRVLRLAVLGESTAAGVGAESHEEALPGFLAAGGGAAHRQSSALDCGGSEGRDGRRGSTRLRALAMDRVVRDLADAAAGVRHAPAGAPFAEGFSAEDGFHPSSSGYRAWAHALAPYVAAGVSRRDTPRASPAPHGPYGLSSVSQKGGTAWPP